MVKRNLEWNERLNFLLLRSANFFPINVYLLTPLRLLQKLVTFHLLLNNVGVESYVEKQLIGGDQHEAVAAVHTRVYWFHQSRLETTLIRI